MKLFIKQKQTRRLREQIYGWRSGEVGGSDSLGVQDGQVHTALFEMDDQQGPTDKHTELCSMLCSSLGGRWV